MQELLPSPDSEMKHPGRATLSLPQAGKLVEEVITMTHFVAEVKEEVLESYWGTGKSSTGKCLRYKRFKPMWGKLLAAEGAGGATYKPGGVCWSWRSHECWSGGTHSEQQR